jgi:hypothetical protein
MGREGRLADNVKTGLLVGATCFFSFTFVCFLFLVLSDPPTVSQWVFNGLSLGASAGFLGVASWCYVGSGNSVNVDGSVSSVFVERSSRAIDNIMKVGSSLSLQGKIKLDVDNFKIENGLLILNKMADVEVTGESLYWPPKSESVAPEAPLKQEVKSEKNEEERFFERVE